MRSNTPSWWCQPNPVDKYACKNRFIFPNFRGENEKKVPPPGPFTAYPFLVDPVVFLASRSRCSFCMSLWHCNSLGSGRRLENANTLFGEFWQGVPSRELTYPTLGKGKSSSKCHFGGICSSLEGNLSLFMKPLVLQLEEYSNWCKNRINDGLHQVVGPNGLISETHRHYNHPGCFPYQKVKLI